MADSGTAGVQAAPCSRPEVQLSQRTAYPVDIAMNTTHHVTGARADIGVVIETDPLWLVLT